MAAAQRTKASDKQAIAKKLMMILKKQYKGSVPQSDRPVLETILYAICLENSSDSRADSVYARLESTFHDWNEMRVSSISELTDVFHDVDRPERRALQVRCALHYLYEKHFKFEFESLRRKTLDLAEKQLRKIKELSGFVRLFTLQSALGSHLVAVDDFMCGAAIWLGLADLGSTPISASEALKSAVRKADGPLFCHLLRSLASDPLVKGTFVLNDLRPPPEGFDLELAPKRLQELFEQASARAKVSVVRKKTAKKAPDRKKTAPSAAKSRTAEVSRSKNKSTAQKKAAGKSAGNAKKTKKKTKTSSGR